MHLKTSAATIALPPVLAAVVTHFGFDQVCYGLNMVVKLFVARTQARVSLDRIGKNLLTFLLVLLVCRLESTRVSTISWRLRDLVFAKLARAQR